MRKGRLLISLLWFSSISLSFGQEMTWQWASLATTRISSSSFDQVACGFKNTCYATCDYDSLICAGDTVINHPETVHGSTINSVVVTFNSEGEFENLVDLHTIPGSMIFDTYGGGDDEENLDLACTFSKRVFLQDTMINHCNTPFIDHPDILVAQLDKSRDLIWARTIGGTLSDQIHGFKVTNGGDIYTVSEHTATDSPPSTIDFFQQDTLITTRGLTAICKLDKTGTFKWRIELYGSLSSYDGIVVAENGLLYYYGNTSYNVIINNDTIINPKISGNYSTFLCCFDGAGNILKAEFIGLPLTVYNMDVNPDGDLFISSYVYDTLVIGHDTTIIPPDLSYRFIGKFNEQYFPDWYYVVPNAANQVLGAFDVVADGDDMVFSSYANHDVQFGDTVIDLPINKVVFTGVFDPEGIISNVSVSHVTGEFLSYDLIPDNCGNLLICGSLKGKIYLENDTVNSFVPGRSDAAIVKFRRNLPDPIYLGPDTTACNEFLLAAPAGYEQYMLNDSILYQNELLITETGNYAVGCANQGCWVFDTIFISIFPGITLDVGSDTTIYASDTIVISVPQIYDSIRWFDGTVSFEKVLIAREFPLGMNYIWAEAYSGPCSATDTLMIDIRSDFGVEEPEITGIKLYPNPFSDEFYVESSVAIDRIIILDCLGCARYEGDFEQGTRKARVSPDGLQSGIYIIQVVTIDGNLKVAKLTSCRY